MMHRLKLDSLRSRLPSWQQSDNEETFYLAKSTAFAGLQTALNAIKEVAGNTGIPGLQEGVKALVIVLDVMQKTSQNADDVEVFTSRVQALSEMLLKAAEDSVQVPEPMLRRIDRLTGTWIASCKEVQTIGSRPYVKRLINHDNDAQAITSQLSVITWAIQSFMVESLLAIEFALDDNHTLIERSAGRIEGKLDNVHQGIQEIKMRQDIYGGIVPRAIAARYDCNEKLKPCHEGTRSNILSMIHRWVNYSDVMSSADALDGDKLQTARVFWVNGPGSAGTGKSTIAYTIARDLDMHRKLGASFFCSRDNDDCRNPKLIFPTIAYQLGQFYAPFQEQLSAVLKTNPDVAYSVVVHQLEMLLVKPIHALDGKMPFCVVVIDALDECRDGGATSIILTSLAQYITALFPVKFLITSRPDASIVSGFKLARLNHTTQRYILHHVEQEVVETDLLLYLHSSLYKTKKMYCLEGSWPTVKDIQALVKLSSGLFIFAATAARFIQDKNYSDPQGQLDRLLGAITLANSSPHRFLDKLYLQVLENAFPNISPEVASRLKMALGSLVLLYEPLSPSNFEQLLDLPIPLNNMLRHLQSVIVLPNDGNEVMRMIHPSFYDFLTDPKRCSNAKFLVTPDLQHAFLAKACFEAMKSLKRDICGIKQPWQLHHELDNLPKLVHQHIPPYVQYACRHWAQHLSHSLLSDKLLGALEEFCRKYLLFWVEVCSLLGDLQGALLTLKIAYQILVTSKVAAHDGFALLHDCQRIVKEFFPLLSVASSQMYISVPAFVPEDTQLMKIYHNEFHHNVKTLHSRNRPQQWDACLQTIEGHTGSVSAAAFSPDGNYIASVSKDCTVQLWDAVSGVHLKTIYGQSKISCVVFSHDSAYFLTGCHWDDCTVKMWDVITGDLVYTMSGHHNTITSVAFSPKSDHIVSGSDDWNVRLWKPWKSVHQLHEKCLHGHSAAVNTVCFSPDNIHIISGSDDTTIRLWNADTGKKLHKFKGHSLGVTTIAFSHKGTQIVSGSWDKTVRLWNVKTGSQTRKLKDHPAIVSSVSFSPEDIYILSASDKTIQLWNTNSGTHLKAFMGHSGLINSAQFSSDGSQIVSASADMTVKLWDAATSTHFNQTPGQSVHTHTVKMSPDGALVASGTDHNIQIWDITTGHHLRALKGHKDDVLSVAFSPNSTFIVSTSKDHTVQLWNTATRTHFKTMRGHTSFVCFAVFSFDGNHIASGSGDKTVRLWEVISGNLLRTLKGHSKSVVAGAFSPTGDRIASASFDHTAQVWNTKTGEVVSIFNGHHEEVTAIVFSPTGVIVASASVDQKIQLWDPVVGILLAVFDMVGSPDYGFKELYFSPDQKFIISPFGCLNIGIEQMPIQNNLVSHELDQPAYYVTTDGWVHSTLTQQRKCWVPHEYRRHWASNVNTLVLGSTTGGVTILDMKALKCD